MMRRVVVTGQGIVSSLGNNTTEVAASLREGRSGLRFNPSYAERGMRCQVSGRPALELESVVERRTLRFMGDAAAYAWLSMKQALEQAGLGPAEVSNPRTGLVAGSGGASSFNQVWAADTLRAKGVKRVGPFMVTRCMGSTVSACLATSFGIKGVNYSISSACATSAHCIGHAAQLIAWGQQDVVFAGGGEEESWEQSLLFDAIDNLVQFREGSGKRFLESCVQIPSMQHILRPTAQLTGGQHTARELSMHGPRIGSFNSDGRAAPSTGQHDQQRHHTRTDTTMDAARLSALRSQGRTLHRLDRRHRFPCRQKFRRRDRTAGYQNTREAIRADV